MRILLFGANGQVGYQLRRSLVTLGEVKALTRIEVNLENQLQITNLIRNYKPHVIVNAAAYTNVDKAEKEPDKAFAINSRALKIISDEIKQLGGLLVHYSTDYVFDGKNTKSYIETDTTNPLSVYGKTKLSGENEIIKSGCNHLIFRTSWVYSKEGANFINTIVKLAKERGQLRVVSDQIGCPTSADFIADITAHCIVQNLHYKKQGIFNITAQGKVSWYELALFVIKELQTRGIKLKTLPENITPINTSEYPLPAERPLYSKLDTEKIKQIFSLNIPKWQYHVKMMLDYYK
ncbi:MAG: dTDP-4-dehydrorhamnose reductase [Rickettsiaceae bacterium]